MLAKNLYLLVVIALVTACNPASTSEHFPPTPPNIVFILTDDQGWGDLSIHGNTNLQTPNIDRLATEGAAFDRFYVSPVCSPTRAEILTGRYHPRGGVYSTSAGGERLDLDEKTVAQYFQEVGYHTAAFGKWHNGMQYPYHPNARGFDEFYGFCSGHWGHYYSPMLEHNGRLVKGNGFLIDDFTERAMQFMEAKKDEPFFIYLPFNTPHSPMQVPDRWWDKFKDKPMAMQHREPEREFIPHTRAALAMCENIDWNVGRLLYKLEALDLDKNTIVVYLSDNGPNGYRWNGDMKGRKGSTDEGGVRSPLFIRWPAKIQAGTKIPQIAGAVDCLPTLADLAGIEYEPHKPLDGLSIKPLLLGTSDNWPDRIVYNHWRGRTSVRSQRFRLDHAGQLFDMKNDPGQRSPVNDQFPEQALKLQVAQETWNASVLSELPENDDRTFPVGHPDFKYTQIPARDGTPHGNIERSNRFPNCSFFTNWVDEEDKITWEVEVLESGKFEAIVYCTCKPENVGAVIELSLGGNKISAKIEEANDPPLAGKEEDRVERIESYVKDFKPWNIGTVQLEKGKGQLTIRALDIPGEEAIEFRLLMLNRI